MKPNEKKRNSYIGGSDREMLREKDYEPQSSERNGDYSYRDSYDAA